MNIIVTGGAGFIGSAVIRYLINETAHKVINLDKLTYAGNLASLQDVVSSDRYHFVQLDIADSQGVQQLFEQYRPNGIMHLAAESHVDRSINGSADFIQTNIIGTYNLLEVSRRYWNALPEAQKAEFRFHHISTDEVYGDLDITDEPFTETNPYAPSSPYSASKASSDHLVRAWFRTYGLPIVITNCSNNYGPYQFPEKLIPLMILNAIAGKDLPVYGDGRQIRDWLHVEDHARALVAVFERGTVGETYNIGGGEQRDNMSVVNTICDLLEEIRPEKPQGVENYRSLIQHVTDRPGHDRRYAINDEKIRSELNCLPQWSFQDGLRQTVAWYLNNQAWLSTIKRGNA